MYKTISNTMNINNLFLTPEEYLGNAAVLSMDWECRGISWHLFMLSLQNTPTGALPYGEEQILRILQINKTDWDDRIKKQLSYFWDIQSEKITAKFFIQKVKKTTPKKSKKHIVNDGFQLDNLLSEKDTATILYEKSNQKEKMTIWQLGINVLGNGENDAQIRRLLGKLIKQYSEKTVAEAITQLSLKNNQPADPQSYLIGILKKNVVAATTNEPPFKGTGRGKVAI